MALIAKNDLENRTTIVSRTELLARLKLNREKHRSEYEQAVAAYPEQLRRKLRVAVENAVTKLNREWARVGAQLDDMSAEDVPGQPDVIKLCDSVYAKLPTPRSYDREYEAAIEMIEWDKRDLIELTYAEFQCFVRDIWDWSDEFKMSVSEYNCASGR